MANKFAYVAGLAGVAVLSWWIGVHRFRRIGNTGLMPEVEDDSSAALIAFYRPAIERALSDPV